MNKYETLVRVYNVGRNLAYASKFIELMKNNISYDLEVLKSGRDVSISHNKLLNEIDLVKNALDVLNMAIDEHGRLVSNLMELIKHLERLDNDE